SSDLICGARVVDRDEHRAVLRHCVHRADRCALGAEELKSLTSSVMGKRCRMFGTPKAVHRIVAGAAIAAAGLLRPSASRALDNVTLITDFGYNGRHAYFFDALDRGYYRNAGLEVKIVRGQGSV